MAQADALIQRDGPVSAPFDIIVPASTDIVPLACSASFDGSGSGAAFVPVLEFIAQNGAVVARCPLDTTIAAGGSADVSWFPWRRVRAATPAPSPNPLGTLWAWFDFSDASTVTLDGSGNIAAITDKTGNGHDLSQPTAANRPGVATVNGLNAGLFASAAATVLFREPTTDSLAQPYTVAIVFTQDTASGAGLFPGPYGAAATVAQGNMFLNNTNTLLSIQQGASGFSTALSAPFTQQQVTAIYDAGSSVLRLNGAAVAGTVDNDPALAIALGGAHHPSLPGENDSLNGKICEVLWYSGHLTAVQIAAVESYLKAKWATP